MAEGAAIVLVVDAEEETRAALGALGQAEGSRVVAAASGDEALLALREHGSQLRLVIASLDLPDMSWVSVIGRIREMHRDLPIIITTTAHTEATELFVRRLGAVLYAPKPLDGDLLRQAIRGALRRRQSSSAASGWSRAREQETERDDRGQWR